MSRMLRWFTPCALLLTAWGCADDPAAGKECSSDTDCPGSVCDLASKTCVEAKGDACSSASDCPAPSPASECKIAVCVSNSCGIGNLPEGSVAATQIEKDCKQVQCDGSGGVLTIPFDSDKPDDGKPCTIDSCDAGTPVHTSASDGTSCGDGLFCTAGECGGCTSPAQCPAAPGECQTPTCSSGGCGLENKAAGVLLASQTPGDCQKKQCDGNGGVESVADNTDIPVSDGKECTEEKCVAGVPSHLNRPEGTACTEEGGNICIGNKCLECLSVEDCPAGNACQIRTCEAGICGTKNKPAGEPVTSASGDCQKAACDGHGQVVAAPDNADLPVDGVECTHDTCTAGVASNPPKASGTPCGKGVCNGSEACVECVSPSDCPAPNPANECQIATCVDNECGIDNLPKRSVAATQIEKDCKQVQCDGSGGVLTIPFDSDTPDDGLPCTIDSCDAGTPVHAPASDGTSCGNGLSCHAGECDGCTSPAQCPAAPGECQTPTCSSGVCGLKNKATGVPLASQTPGDCQKKQCDGYGGVESVADNTDIPVSDGRECTEEMCVAGVPSHRNKPKGSLCTEGGGNMCIGNECLECDSVNDCPRGIACQIRTCEAGICGFAPIELGPLPTDDTPGDCKALWCDGSGHVTAVTENSDLPVDGKACTDDLCTDGIPSNLVSCPAGEVCDLSGNCAPGSSVPIGWCNIQDPKSYSAVAGTTNAIYGRVWVEGDLTQGNGQLPGIKSKLCFSASPIVAPANLSSLICINAIFNTDAGNNDEYVAGLKLDAPGVYYYIYAFSGDNEATWTICDTDDDIQNALVPGQANITGTAGACTPSKVVISQLYGSGGSSSAPESLFKNDFVELHNRSTQAVAIGDWSIQYTSATGSSWATAKLSIPAGTTLPPGGYYLIALAAGSTGEALPTADLTGSTNMSGTAGKLALASNGTALTGTCPSGGALVDLVGFGTTANCSEGSSNAPVPSNILSLQRADSGCTDTENNGSNFTAATPAPRNSATTPHSCGCQ